MGSVAVLRMAEVAPTQRHGASQKPLHPFFAPKPSTAARDISEGTKNNHKDPATNETASDSDGTAGQFAQDEDCVKTLKRGRRAKHRRVEAEAEGEGRKSLEKRGRPRKIRAPHGRDIKQLFTKTEAVEANTQFLPQPEDALPARSPEKVRAAATVVVEAKPESKVNTTTPSDTAVKSESEPSKKVLKLNTKTGTIGSPPKPKPQTAKAEGRRRKRKKGSAEGENETFPPKLSPWRIVHVKYGIDEASRLRIGQRVAALLNESPLPAKQEGNTPAGPKGFAPSEREEAALQPREPPPKTHPFFEDAGQAKKADAPRASDGDQKAASAPPRQKTLTSTPCLPKKSSRKVPVARLPQFGLKVGSKPGGANLPPWPCKNTVHVRGETHSTDNKPHALGSLPSLRKSKGHAVHLAPWESIMDVFAKTLDVPSLVQAVHKTSIDDILPLSPELRLPTRHTESGTKLQSRIAPQLSTWKPTEKGKARPERLEDFPPQLYRLWNSIRTSLAAFDRCDCENLAWVHKYAPGAAVEVLQPGQEVFMMRKWLQALTVQSIETGSSEADKASGNIMSQVKPSGGSKKRKRRKKLDDFVVTDDEASLMDDASENEHDWAPSGAKGITRKTVARSGDIKAWSKDGTRVANAIVISGPHGCGKTSAVYAVAKELDFEVFEINPNTRRSGRDVLEKIGDMTQNHLVQQPGKVKDEGVDEAAAMAQEAAREVKSGKQATMLSLFMPEPTAAAPKLPTRPHAVKAVEVKKEAPKSQRQSLILLDEVDILYEEDKHFWATVIGLIGQSKRPFLMTCNDETLIPLQGLNLHGILRFTRPPTHLAVDRLLLIAANEGHALKREPVEALYESRAFDLRAATMELNYWCQTGVGDRRGGLDWGFRRWPRGVDLDENKDVIRVVSEDTYVLGMNWLARDPLFHAKTPEDLEKELLQQTWDSWQLDLGLWQDSDQFPHWGEATQDASSRTQRLDQLVTYDAFADAMSAADMCLCGCRPSFLGEAIDATLPPPSAKTREDLILGLCPLDTPDVTRYDHLSAKLSCALKSLAQGSLQNQIRTALPDKAATQPSSLTEALTIRRIRHRLTNPPPDRPSLARLDLAFAFDPIASSSTAPPLSHLEPSVFDRTTKLITLEVAPYVRGILSYETRLQEQRLHMSSMASEGGHGVRARKRMRTTRAALSALEGGVRSRKRGAAWFRAEVDVERILKTGGEGWPQGEMKSLVGDVGALQNGLVVGKNTRGDDAVFLSAGTWTPPKETWSPPDRATSTPPVRKRGRPKRKRRAMLSEESADELARGKSDDTSMRSSIELILCDSGVGVARHEHGHRSVRSDAKEQEVAQVG